MDATAVHEEYLDPNKPSSREDEEWDIFSDPYFFARYRKDEDKPGDIVFHVDARISKLRRQYEFRDGLVLENFLRESLRENPRLGSLLLEARRVIREKFSFGTRVALEVVEDPEAPGDQELFVVIRSRFRPKIARALLSELDREWWRDAARMAQGKMELDLE